MKENEKEFKTLIGAALDFSNNMTAAERGIAFVLSPFMDPGIVVGRFLKKHGITLPENDDNWHLTEVY